MGSNEDELIRRFEESMERDWAEFRRELADRLAGLVDGGFLVVAVAPGTELAGASPYCQVKRYDDGLRVEAVSNAYLDRSCRLDRAEEAALGEIGFAPAEAGNFWLELPSAHADEAAVLVVRALREVYAVIHPSQLDGGGARADNDRGDQVRNTGSERVDPDEDRMRRVSGRDGLVKALFDVLSARFGERMDQDEDGDMMILTPLGVGVWIYVSPMAPRILVHALLVLDVQDEARALAEVNVLSMQNIGLSFVLQSGQVAVSFERGLMSWDEDEVLTEIGRVVERVDEWSDGLVARVGGRRQGDEEVPRAPVGQGPPDRRQRGDRRRTQKQRDPRLVEALRVVRELEAEEPGSLDPATLAAIFGGDRTLLLGAMDEQVSAIRRWGLRARTAQQREDAARQDRFLAMCRARQKYHHRLRSRLRSALRLTVQPSGATAAHGQGTLFGADECTEAAG